MTLSFLFLTMRGFTAYTPSCDGHCCPLQILHRLYVENPANDSAKSASFVVIKNDPEHYQ